MSSTNSTENRESSQPVAESSEIDFESCPAIDLLRDLDIEDSEAEQTDPRSEHRRRLIEERRSAFLAGHGNAGPPTSSSQSYSMYMNQPATQSTPPSSVASRNTDNQANVGNTGNIGFIHGTGVVITNPDLYERVFYETILGTDFITRRYTLGNGRTITIQEPRHLAAPGAEASDTVTATNVAGRADDSTHSSPSRIRSGSGMRNRPSPAASGNANTTSNSASTSGRRGD